MFDKDDIQDYWDHLIVQDRDDKVLFKLSKLIGVMESLDLMDGSDFIEKVDCLRRMGIKRLPESVHENHMWLLVYKNISVSVWLSRAVPGSFDAMFDKSIDENIEYLRSKKFKKLVLKHSYQKKIKTIREKGGYNLKIKARDIDKRHDWKVVK